jgi:hypothetical protein
MPHIQVSEEGVRKQLQGLDSNKAAGPDGISPRVLKELADSLSAPLAEIFQTTIDTGTTPTQWKTALVTPIFKKGDKHRASNYRPVSLTAVCCKLCEHVIAKAMLNHMDSHMLLSDLQHGFRRKRSCESQLIIFVDELARGVSRGQQIDAVVMDFSKAFDVVQHGSLLVKLNYYGIRGSTLKWIDSFLTNRSQRVVVDGDMSEVAPVTSGVPQGSVLGPILFLVYINDMPECISSTSRLFADDTIVYRPVSNEGDCQILQKDLQALERWETLWGMSFNPSKCNVVRITRKKKPLKLPYMLKNEELESAATAGYLGVTISQDLSWNTHIAKVIAKGNRALGFLRRNINTRSITTKSNAYNTIVRPTLEYAASVWAPGYKTLISALEAVQRRAARYVSNDYRRRESVTNMMLKLGWESLEERRNKSRVSVIYKIVNKLIAIPDTQLVRNRAPTRGHDLKFHRIATRTNYHKDSFFPTAISLWNALPPDLVKLKDTEHFRKALNKCRVPSVMLRF